MLIGFLLFMSWASPALAKQSPRDLDKILAEGTLRVGVISRDDAPFIIHTEQGVQGFDAAIIRDMAQLLGVRVEFVALADTHNGLIDAIARNEADLGISCLSITMERVHKVDFSDPYKRFTVFMLIHRQWMESMDLVDEDGQISWAQFPPCRIGTVQGTAYVEHLRKYFPSSEHLLYPSLAQAHEAVLQGKVDALLYDNQMDVLFLDDPSSALTLLMARSTQIDPVAIALPKNTPNLKAWLDTYIRYRVPELEYLDILTWQREGMKKPILHKNEFFIFPSTHLPLPSAQVGGEADRSEPVLALIVASFSLLVVFPIAGMIRRTGGLAGGLKSFLRSRWLVLPSTALGLALGLWSSHAGAAFFLPAKIFLAALKVCSLPMMITALISSTAHMVRTNKARAGLNRYLLLACLSFTALTVFMFLLSAGTNPGNRVTEIERDQIGQIILDSEMTLSDSPPVSGPTIKIVDNLIRAMTEDQLLVVAVFCVLLGLALGLSRHQTADRIVDVAQTLFQTLLKMVNWIIVLLPIGLFSLMAWTVSALGWAAFSSMRNFLFIFAVACVVAAAGAVLAISLYLRVPFRQVATALKESFILSLSTGNAVAALPLFFKGMEPLAVNQDHVKLTLPVGILFFDVKKVFLFCITGVFFAQLYGVPVFQDQGWLVILFGSLAAAFMTVGMKGAAYMATISLFLDPLGVPVSSSLALLMAIYPLVDLLGSAANLMVNGAFSICSARADEESTTDASSME
jgi:proton glutamate symport protein